MAARPAGVCSGDCLQNSDFSTPRNVLAVISPIPRERFFAFSLVLVCPLLNLPGQLMSKPLCVKPGKAEVRLNVQEPGAVVMSQSVGKRGSASSWKLTKS